jgi:putative acetyltransferase
MSDAVRQAGAGDASRLFELRRLSILSLAIDGMTFEAARIWADKHLPEWMTGVLATRQVWVWDGSTGVLGWVSFTDDVIDGLYVHPRAARSGIGSRLVRFAEDRIAHGGFRQVRLEASANAVGFYKGLGYLLTQPGLRGDSERSVPMTRIVTPSRR